MLLYAKVTKIIHKHATFHSLKLASPGRKQLRTNARKHIAVRPQQRNVETDFQWCKRPQTCEVMLRSDAGRAVRQTESLRGNINVMKSLTPWNADNTPAQEVLNTLSGRRFNMQPPNTLTQPKYLKHDTNKKYGRRKKLEPPCKPQKSFESGEAISIQHVLIYSL